MSGILQAAMRHGNMIWAIAAGTLHVALAAVATAHILLNKDDTKSAAGWIGLVWLAPITGGLLYIILGVNRIQRKALRLRRKTSAPAGPDADEHHQPPGAIHSPRYADFLRFADKALKQKFSHCVSIEPLINGDEAYPAMIEAITRAQKQILLASYIFDNDEAGRAVAAALKAAARRGVHARVLLDGVGVRYSTPTIETELRDIPNLELRLFLPAKTPFALPFVNLRNHRKMLITDSDAAIIGGMNISRGNLLKKYRHDAIADITFRVCGPVTDQLARVFEEDWLFSGGRKFRLAQPQPCPAKPEDNTLCRAVADGPDSDTGRIEWLLLGAIACAQKNITIVTPYFLPGSGIMNALELAAMRGVGTEIILPGKSNIFGMDWAMEANFPGLLKAGVKIYRTPAPFDHSKLTVVDGLWSFIGSANWDVRSLRLNFEANLECLGEAFARKLLAVATEKKSAARLIKTRHGQRLSLPHQLRNNAFRLLTPYY
ncbi:MAG: phospholipase D-like domain-containing protein [Elusimicrobiaceae bacterium]|nr:phospholipase D-like domain-containing protein [Elusimicrobiaceae bacterium]